MPILHNVSMRAEEGQITTIVGPNGSGKSTLLKVIFGFLEPFQGEIIYNEEDIIGVPPYKMIKKGMGYLTQDRSAFPKLSVVENLDMGAWSIRRKKDEIKKAKKLLYEKYPFLKDRRDEKAETLSGGQQRILEIARLMMTRPDLLLIDEPASALAPIAAEDVYNEIEKLKKEGITIILVDQNVKKAISIADYVYILKFGSIVQQAPSEKFMENLEDLIAEWL